MNNHGNGGGDGGGFDSFRFAPLNKKLRKEEKKKHEERRNARKAKCTLSKPIIAVTGADQCILCSNILFCILSHFECRHRHHFVHGVRLHPAKSNLTEKMPCHGIPMYLMFVAFVFRKRNSHSIGTANAMFG